MARIGWDQDQWKELKGRLAQKLQQTGCSAFFRVSHREIFDMLKDVPRHHLLIPLQNSLVEAIMKRTKKSTNQSFGAQRFVKTALLAEDGLAESSLKSISIVIRNMLNIIEERESIIYFYKQILKCMFNPNYRILYQPDIFYSKQIHSPQLDCLQQQAQKDIKNEINFFKDKDSIIQAFLEYQDQSRDQINRLSAKLQKLMSQHEYQRLLNFTENSQKIINVSTLNYCKITYSPFQFIGKKFGPEISAISQIFRRLITQYIPSFNERYQETKMGYIEQNYKKGRFSHMFELHVGISQGSFLNRRQFENRWNLQFDKQIKKAQYSWNIQERDAVRLYDVIMYHALLIFVYNKPNFQQVIREDPQVFIQKLRPLYQISFLNEEQKAKKFLNGMLATQSDVFFLQEYSKILYDLLINHGSFHVTKDILEDCLIILKKKSFFEIKSFRELARQIIDEQYWRNILWTRDVAIITADEYIFISLNLSSKGVISGWQRVGLKQMLIRLRQMFPSYELIIGVDKFTFMVNDSIFASKFDLYPRYEFEFTTIKKRTFSQAQFRKANQEVRQSKDRIISTLRIIDGEISYLNGDKADGRSYIPTHEHPHDHFLVNTKIGSKRV